MSWFICPNGHEIEEYKFGWYCKTCKKGFANKVIRPVVPQTNIVCSGRVASVRPVKSVLVVATRH